MATFNLSRNARVFLCQDVDATTGVIASSGTLTNSGATRTTEITVLDGLSFSQASQSTTISLNEAGSTPVRGQRTFNTSLDPVEFSFSSYLGPYGTTVVDFAERTLWNALVSPVGIELSYAPTITAITRASSTAATATIVHSSFSYTTMALAVGDNFQITAGSSAPTTSFQRWSGSAKLVSASPTMGAATTSVIEYSTAPASAAGTAATIPTSVLLYKGGYFRSLTSTTSEAYAEVNTAVSNKNQLQKFGMIFKMDGAIYAVDNCVIESAAIDFGIDGIATVAWTGKGSALRQLTSLTISDATPAVFGGSGAPTGTAASALAVSHLTNKLSAVVLTSNIQGASGSSYTLPITAGSITIANNATYLTPAALRTVNTPINYFLGARSITGSLSAYLRTGSGNTAQLLTDIIAQGTEPKFSMTIDIGGATGRRVEVIMNGVSLQVPSIETADVITTTINFNAQGYDPVAANNAYDMEYSNDLILRAYGQ